MQGFNQTDHPGVSRTGSFLWRTSEGLSDLSALGTKEDGLRYASPSVRSQAWQSPASSGAGSVGCSPKPHSCTRGAPSFPKLRDDSKTAKRGADAQSEKPCRKAESQTPQPTRQSPRAGAQCETRNRWGPQEEFPERSKKALRGEIMQTKSSNRGEKP